MGLSLNAQKTEYMTVNITSPDESIKSINGDTIKHVTDFKYLGSYISDSRKDFNTRKGMAWSACIKGPM